MRRGMSSEAAIITIIIFGAVLIVAAILYTTLFDIGEKEFSKRECQTSLLLTTTVQTKYDSAGGVVSCRLALDNPIPIKCSRRFLTVTEDDVLRDGKSVKFEYNPVCPDEDPSARIVARPGQKASDIVQVEGACMAENVLAKEMANCWNTFFNGEALVFQQVEQDLDGVWDDNEHDRACFVCAEVTLRDGKGVRDFADYLKEKEYVLQRDYYTYLARNPQARCNSNIRSQYSDDGTCWSAFSREMDSGWLSGLGFAPQNWPGLNQTHFPDGKTYAVTFVRYGMEAACETNDNKEDAPTMSVQVIPSENIGMYCDVVLT